MKPLNLKYRDAALAFMVMLGSLLVSVFAYARILEIERPNLNSLALIPLGNVRYAILNQNRCVGNFTNELQKDSVYLLSTHMEMRGKYRDRYFSAKVDIEASFNPLRQMNQSSIIIRGLNVNVKAQSTGVNPIKFHIDSEIDGNKIIKEWEMPGPIKLIESSDHPDNYHLDIRSFPNSQSRYTQGISDTLLKSLGISTQKLELNDTRCQSGVLAAMNITALVDSLRGLYGNQVINQGGLSND